MSDSAPQFYLAGKAGDTSEPLGAEEIRRRIDAGQLSGRELCWREGMAGWQPLAETEPFATRFPSPDGTGKHLPPLPITPTAPPETAKGTLGGFKSLLIGAAVIAGLIYLFNGPSKSQPGHSVPSKESLSARLEKKREPIVPKTSRSSARPVERPIATVRDYSPQPEQPGTVWRSIRVEGVPLSHVSCCLYDKSRNCVWFSQGGNLCKYDLRTDKAMLVTDGKDKGGIGAQSMALEGGHLWVGGHGAYGGGLWMYDIPSDSAIVYRVENTMEGTRKGLQSNWAWNILTEQGLIWIYSHNWVSSWGLTRFAYGESDHARRWTTWTVKNTTDETTKKKGLVSNFITGLVPAKDGGYWLFFDGSDREGYVYQHFDPAGPSFQIYRLMPPRHFGIAPESDKVEAVNVRGETAKVWQLQNSPRCEFIAWREGRIWFHAGLQSDDVWGDRFGFRAELCFDPEGKSYLLYNPASTESRPGAGDGMFDHAGSYCFDGNEIWMSHSALGHTGISRFNRETGEFTHYTAELAGELSGFPYINQIPSITVGGDYVFFGTSTGLLRFKKTPLGPRMVRSSPAQGEVDVEVQRELTVTFDLPLNPRTVHSRSVELLVNGALFGGTVNYNPGTRTIVFSIPNRLPSGMNCELICKSLIQAENGNPIRWTRIKFRPR